LSTRPENGPARSDKYNRHLSVAQRPRPGVLGLASDNESITCFVTASNRANFQTYWLSGLRASWISVHPISLVDVAFDCWQRMIRADPPRITGAEDRAQSVLGDARRSRVKMDRECANTTGG
jgi:hypothetical protein